MCYKKRIQLCSNDLWALLVLLLLLLHGNAHSAGENILTKPGLWLETLSQEDQKIALVKYQIRLGEKVNDVLLNAKSSKDKLWSVKILMCGHELASRFATKNKEQKEAVTFMADSLSDAIAGEGTAESRRIGVLTA